MRNTQPVMIGDLMPRAIMGRDKMGMGDAGQSRTVMDAGLVRAVKRLTSLGATKEDILRWEDVALEGMNKGLCLCESPIERTMLTALIVADYSGFHKFPPFVHDPKKDCDLPDGELIIVPQCAFIRFRMDFGIVVRAGDYQKLFGVECDGEGFHAPDKDRLRDAYLESWGVTMTRFQGKEIYADPLHCADRVLVKILEWRDAHQ